VTGDGPASAWYEDGLSFECQRCGRCCSGAPGDVWVSSQEAAGIAAELGQAPEAFAAECLRTHRGRLSLRERADYDCVLLDQTSRTCRVYQARPLQCRTWPWWPENLRTPEAWHEAARECPGIGHGPVTPAEHIRQALEAERVQNAS
jgi:hypothetical protein